MQSDALSRDRAAEVDLLCFSYLAPARVCRIDHYPDVNRGAHISDVAVSVAGDGPIVAITASALGLRAGLVCNDVGADADGEFLLGYLARHGVQHRSVSEAGLKTPFAIILVDDDGNREWFSYIGNSFANTWQESWTSLPAARLMYVDVYADLIGEARTAIERAKLACIPLYLNVAQSPLTDDLAMLLNESGASVVQASADAESGIDAYDLARRFSLASRSSVVVTLGAKGAAMFHEDGTYSSPAPRAVIQHSHGAGAAFSAAFCQGLLSGWSAASCLTYATFAGTLRCSSSPAVETFTAAELRDFVAAVSSADQTRPVAQNWV